MSDPIQKVLVQMTHLDMFGVKSAKELDVKGWVANQHYLFDHDLTPTAFSVRTSDKSNLSIALANDCNRMAMAAIESVAGVRLDDPFKSSGAWAIIRVYYATFFAVHSIMRMYGISCCQLESKHTSKLFQIADLLGKTGGERNIENGFYAIQIDKRYENLNFVKYKDSHKDTWDCFSKLITKVAGDIRGVTALSHYKLEATDILLSIKEGLVHGGRTSCGNWLSQIRNSVNYQHSHGVWYPYERKPVVPQYIVKLAADWTKSPTVINHNIRKSDIEAFFELSADILSLFKTLLTSCINRYESAKTIFANGSYRQLNSLKLV